MFSHKNVLRICPCVSFELKSLREVVTPKLHLQIFCLFNPSSPLITALLNMYYPNFSGVGIVLITVSGIAWRLTATDAPSCRAMLGLGGGCEEDYNNGRFLSRPQVTGSNNCIGQTGIPGNGGANAGGGAGGANGGGPGSRTQHPYAGNFTGHCNPNFVL